MTYEHLRVIDSGAVRTVKLARPAVHNAFDELLIAELTACFRDTASQESLRLLVLAGEGASFCAGADLAWMGRMVHYSAEENAEDARALQAMFAALAACPQVTAARVHGAALGGGAGLVAVCDVAISAEDAVYGFTEVRLGLAPAVISPYVVRKIGMGHARTLFVTGERIAAADALRLGLIQRVVPLDGLDAAMDRLTGQVLASGPVAVAATKRLLHDLEQMPPEEIAERTVECISRLRVGAEGQEGIHAFLAKRKPAFALPPETTG